MGSADKAKQKTKKGIGKAKEAKGKATHDDELVREGKAEQAQASSKQVVDKVKDAGADITKTLTKPAKDKKDKHKKGKK